MNKIFNKINSFSLSFLTLVFLTIFSTQQAKADCFVDDVQFDIGGRAGSGVTAVDHSNPITLTEIKGWDTSGDDVTTCDVSTLTNLSSAFQNQSSFNQDIGSWDTSKVTNMSGMFGEAYSFNENICSWDVSNVTNMDGMFTRARNFNQDLTKWCVTNITSEPPSFSFASALIEANKPIWGTCPN